MTRTVLVAVCVTLVLAACGAERAAESPAPTEETVTETPGPSASPPGGAAAEAVADLAARLEVAEDDVVVDSVEEVTWRDGSLGCAEKGTMYTQALVDGSRITLRVAGQTYEYHSGGRRSAFLCERPTE